MYCSTCGVAVAKDRSYCNHCGAKLVRTEGLDPSEVRSEFVLAAIVGLFILGLVAISVLGGVLKVVLQLETGQVLGFVAFSFLIMIMLEAVCLGMLWRNRRRQGKRDTALPKEQVTNELDAPHARVLAEPVPSVTENTTRAFEPIYNERTSK